jgi:predicted dinucleotide-binding enzyme
MDIAILGAGDVGGTLGRRFASIGHTVHFGVPNPNGEKYQKLVSEIGTSSTINTVTDAARKADVILLATPWGKTEAAIKEAGDLSGKIIIDATNPLKFDDSGLSLSLGFSTSGAETVAQWAKGARVVKTFNQTGFENMANPEYPDGRNVMFVCGDDADARETVRHLAEEIGFEAVDAGALSVARLLEPLAMLWIHLYMKTDLKRGFAFAIMRR